MKDPKIIDQSNRDLMLQLDSFVVPVFKEAGYSSGFFVNQIRKRLSGLRRVKRFKVGHAGTLDPFAEGVLVTLCGKATRLQDDFMRRTKVYEAVVRLGTTTPSFDPDTEISRRDVAFELDQSRLPLVLSDYQGEIEQVPPLFSAKKVDGVRAYKLARLGSDRELEPRRVRVDGVELLGVDGNDIQIRVTCGPGFYMRALARDLATDLGTLGYLTSLTRTRSGAISVEQCLRLRQVLDVGSEGG